jgi:hypothetical protein
MFTGNSRFFILLFSFFLSYSGGFAQEMMLSDSCCEEKDLKDVLMNWVGMDRKEKGPDKGSWIVVPIFGSNPATGFMVGVGGQAAFKLLQSPSYSSISGSFQYTSKRQMIVMLKNNISIFEDKVRMTGDWRYLKFSQSTYGLGTSSPEGGLIDFQYHLAGVETTMDSLAQPMTFNLARMHQTIAFRMIHGLYLGIGFDYDNYFKIKDEKFEFGPSDTLITSHFLYNLFYGFDTKSYSYSAMRLSLEYDTRDNIINPYRGVYAMAAWRAGYKFLGNHKTNHTFQAEYRSFHGLSRKNPSHLIAFWLMGDFSRQGDLPYLTLPATAYDQRGRSARGYTQGRFRGPNYVYGEVEYRFPISRSSGLLGGVVFANVTTTDNPLLEEDLFKTLRGGYGTGLRVKVDKGTRMNLAIDVAFGHRSFGFYLAATETF